MSTHIPFQCSLCKLVFIWAEGVFFSSSNGFCALSLQALQPLFSSDEEPGPRDNAVGAVANMLSVAAAHLPLEQIMPVYLGALPLKEDVAEAPIVYGTLCQLLLSDQAQRISSFVPQTIAAFGTALLSKPLIGDEAIQSIGRTMNQLMAQYAQQLQGVVEALPQEQQDALAAAAAAQ